MSEQDNALTRDPGSLFWKDIRCFECGEMMTNHVIVTRHATGSCEESFTGPALPPELEGCLIETERSGALNAFQRIAALVEHDSPVYLIAAEHASVLAHEQRIKEAEPVAIDVNPKLGVLIEINGGQMWAAFAPAYPADMRGVLHTKEAKPPCTCSKPPLVSAGCPRHDATPRTNEPLPRCPVNGDIIVESEFHAAWHRRQGTEPCQRTNEVMVSESDQPGHFRVKFVPASEKVDLVNADLVEEHAQRVSNRDAKLKEIASGCLKVSLDPEKTLGVMVYTVDLKQALQLAYKAGQDSKE